MLLGQTLPAEVVKSSTRQVAQLDLNSYRPNRLFRWRVIFQPFDIAYQWSTNILKNWVPPLCQCLLCILPISSDSPYMIR